ncbi:MAG: hypothetical protein DMD81_21240 [Candidatus Rokuibacteriota bacterium]|nr:MAG: hypothetical protein DMD81_21240 [Candidatus Rokubacteria bacterium]
MRAGRTWLPGRIALAAMLVIVASAAPAGARTIGEIVDDARIAAEIKAKLTADKLSNLTKIDVKSDTGVVTLGGTVDSMERRDRAAQIAAAVTGVKGVVNNLQVKGGAPGEWASSGGPTADGRWATLGHRRHRNGPERRCGQRNDHAHGRSGDSCDRSHDGLATDDGRSVGARHGRVDPRRRAGRVPERRDGPGLGLDDGNGLARRSRPKPDHADRRNPRARGAGDRDLWQWPAPRALAAPAWIGSRHPRARLLLRDLWGRQRATAAVGHGGDDRRERDPGAVDATELMGGLEGPPQPPNARKRRGAAVALLDHARGWLPRPRAPPPPLAGAGRMSARWATASSAR